jgi:hypothetical protein
VESLKLMNEALLLMEPKKTPRDTQKVSFKTIKISVLHYNSLDLHKSFSVSA